MTSAPRRTFSDTDSRMSASRFSEPGPSGPLLGSSGGSCPASASNPANHQPGATTTAAAGQPRAAAAEEPKPKAPSAPNPNIRKANAIDRYSRVIFPVIFAAFTITYWVTYIHISHGQMAVTGFNMK